MASARIDLLLGFIKQKPKDPFPRYALALEYKNGGRLDDAKAEFDILLRDHADYIAGYLHAGNLYVSIGNPDEAALIYRRGIDVCTLRNDAHARAELEGALSAIGSDGRAPD